MSTTRSTATENEPVVIQENVFFVVCDNLPTGNILARGSAPPEMVEFQGEFTMIVDEWPPQGASVVNGEIVMPAPLAAGARMAAPAPVWPATETAALLTALTKIDTEAANLAEAVAAAADDADGWLTEWKRIEWKRLAARHAAKAAQSAEEIEAASAVDWEGETP